MILAHIAGSFFQIAADCLIAYRPPVLQADGRLLGNHFCVVHAGKCAGFRLRDTPRGGIVGTGSSFRIDPQCGEWIIIDYAEDYLVEQPSIQFIHHELGWEPKNPQ